MEIRLQRSFKQSYFSALQQLCAVKQTITELETMYKEQAKFHRGELVYFGNKTGYVESIFIGVDKNKNDLCHEYIIRTTSGQYITATEKILFKEVER